MPYTDSEENLLNFIQNGGLDVKEDVRDRPNAPNGELAKPPMLEDSRNVFNLSLQLSLKLENRKIETIEHF